MGNRVNPVQRPLCQATELPVLSVEYRLARSILPAGGRAAARFGMLCCNWVIARSTLHLGFGRGKPLSGPGSSFVGGGSFSALRRWAAFPRYRCERKKHLSALSAAPCLCLLAGQETEYYQPLRPGASFHRPLAFSSIRGFAGLSPFADPCGRG